ncbi:Translation initiation factor 3 subunit b [Podila clonocystis]|nr:Translation initiation factor 3 subunit b [Podila clonocystis]
MANNTTCQNTLHQEAAGHRHCCSIIPSFVLKHIAENTDVSQETRDIALKTLNAIPALHQARATAVANAAPQSRGRHLRIIYDAKNGDGFVGRELLFSDPDGPPVITEDNKDNLQAALNVYTHFKQIYDFYHDEFGRDSFDGYGANFDGTVHFDGDGPPVGYVNAFWDGKHLAFGDGDFGLFGSFANILDITAHEVTHAVVMFTANLAFGHQTGALNESISDVFGSMIKQYFAPGGKQKVTEADWLIGEGIFLVPNARALRDLAHPGTAYNNPLVGRDPQGATMSEYFHGDDDDGGVHWNCGIPNRAFHLAAMSIGGYSWEGAGKVWYASLMDPKSRRINLNPTHAFKEFAKLTCKHAEALGGQPWLDAVKEGWTTVGVLNNS